MVRLSRGLEAKLARIDPSGSSIQFFNCDDHNSSKEKMGSTKKTPESGDQESSFKNELMAKLLHQQHSQTKCEIDAARVAEDLADVARCEIERDPV